jgi:hypothetical protein
MEGQRADNSCQRDASPECFSSSIQGNIISETPVEP